MMTIIILAFILGLCYFADKEYSKIWRTRTLPQGKKLSAEDILKICKDIQH